MRVSKYHFPAEYIKGSGIHKEQIILLKTFFAMLQQQADGTHELYYFFNFRKIGLECGPDRGATPNPEIFWRRCARVYTVPDTAECLQHPDYAIAFDMVLIVG